MVQSYQVHRAQAKDNLPRTVWFGPEIDPTVPGNYECSSTGDDSGFIFTRKWDGAQWVSSVTFQPTTVRMHWRGVVPGSIAVGSYSPALRVHLIGTPVNDLVAKGHQKYAEQKEFAPSDVHAAAMGALYS